MKAAGTRAAPPDDMITVRGNLPLLNMLDPTPRVANVRPFLIQSSS
jgi:hypothetical protein